MRASAPLSLIARPRQPLLCYAVAVAATAAAGVIGYFLQPLVYPTVTPPFILAVALSALYGGIGPGLLAAALGAVVLNFWFFPPLHVLGTQSSADIARQLVYLVVATVIAWLGGTVHTQRWQAVRANAALRETEERFRLITEVLAGCFYDYDVKTGDVERFGGLKEVLGFEPAEVPPTAEWWIERIHPEDLPRVMEKVGKVFGSSDASGYVHEYRMRHREGHYIYIVDRGRVVRDTTGQIVRCLGGISDITDRKHSQQALHANEERTRLATGALAGFLYQWDPATNHLEWFGGLEEVLGFSLAEVKPDMAWYESRVHPEDLAKAWEGVRRAFETGAPFYLSMYRFLHRDGHYVTVADRGRILRDETGRPTRVVGGVSDISQRKRAEEALHASEERFRLATEALAGFVYDLDPIADRVSYFGQMEQILGFRPDEVPGDGAWWRARVHPEDVVKTRQARDAVISGDAPNWAIEYRMLHRDGRYVEVMNRWHAVIDRTGRVVRVVGGVYDVSERRRFERQRESLLELEREARGAAEAAARERDTMLGIVSHDLATPLSAIAMCATGLRAKPQSVADRRKAVDLIDRAVDYMNHLISDLVDVASIEAGRLALYLGEEDPAAIVSGVIEMLSPAAAERGVALEAKVDADLPAIRADGVRVLQAMTNLVTNAVQFTDGGGSVTVRAEAEQGDVRFTVEDTGQGILEEDLPHVFDRYWQKRPRVGRHSTGLGLAITRGIVEAHGSALRAESAAGLGSRFTFSIPAATRGVPMGR